MYYYIEKGVWLTMNNTEEISVGKMKFTVINEYPQNLEMVIKKQLEKQLFNIFKKYTKK